MKKIGKNKPGPQIELTTSVQILEIITHVMLIVSSKFCSRLWYNFTSFEGQSFSRKFRMDVQICLKAECNNSTVGRWFDA